MKITFSDHSITKIDILRKHGINISEDMARDIIRNPDKTEEGYKNRIISQGKLDENHVLRVVYEKINDDILVVTLYPGRNTRYDKS